MVNHSVKQKKAKGTLNTFGIYSEKESGGCGPRPATMDRIETDGSGVALVIVLQADPQAAIGKDTM